MRSWVFAAATLLALVGAPRRGEAVPMWTDLATVRKDATSIVIGTVQAAPGDIVIDVDTVLRGTVGKGPLKLKNPPEGTASVGAGNRVVAFVDGTGAFKWVGARVAGSTIEDGVLQLSGFFDFNAHIVSPGVMSLAQLKSYLASGKLAQTFAATLLFDDGHGRLARSSRTFTVRHDHDAKTTQVQGLSFACLGSPSVRGLDWGSFQVTFSDTCPQPGASAWKSLDLEGTFAGLDTASGAIQVDVTPSRPLLDEREMDLFGKDGTIRDVVRVVRIALPDGTAWTWRVGAELVDPRGGKHAAGGFSSSSRTSNGVTISENVYDFGGPKVTLQPGAPVSSPGGNAHGLVPMVRAGTVTNCVLTLPTSGDVGCTLTEEKPMLVKK